MAIDDLGSVSGTSQTVSHVYGRSAAHTQSTVTGTSTSRVTSATATTVIVVSASLVDRQPYDVETVGTTRHVHCDSESIRHGIASYTWNFGDGQTCNDIDEPDSHHATAVPALRR